MAYQLWQLAQKVKGKLIGDGSLCISGVGGVEDVKEGEITFITHHSYREAALSSKAAAFLVSQELPTDRPQILVENPRLAFAQMAQLFLPPPTLTKGIHSHAIVHPSADIGEEVSIGPYVVVERDAIIGRGTSLGAHSYIGAQVVIGEDSFLHQGVVIGQGVMIGHQVIVQANSVVGSDGYGYEEGPHGLVKIPHLGTVIIQDRVELGACVTIDRATTGATTIGTGTKVDNHVHIGHNVKIGPNCLLVGMVGVSGSSTLGEGVILAGQVGVSDHVSIGDRTTVGARGLVLKDLPPHSFYFGVPVQEQKKELRSQAIKGRLPEMYRELRSLKKEVEQLKRKEKQKGVSPPP